MKFEIQNVVVLKRRHKIGDEYFENWKKYDEWEFEKIETLGYRPPYYIGHTNSLSKCLNPRNLQIAFSRTTNKNDTNPFQMIEKVFYTYEEMDGTANDIYELWSQNPCRHYELDNHAY